MPQNNNAHFLSTVYSIVKSLNLCESQYGFSILCGRSPAWFSAAKCQDLPFSTEVAMTLIMRLQEFMAKPDLPTAKKHDAEYLCNILKSVVRTRLSPVDRTKGVEMADYAK